MIRSKLKERRLSLGYTQQYVADFVPIRRTYYTEIENGNRHGNIEIWARIGEILKIPESELVPYIREGTQKGEEG